MWMDPWATLDFRLCRFTGSKSVQVAALCGHTVQLYTRVRSAAFSGSPACVHAVPAQFLGPSFRGMGACLSTPAENSSSINEEPVVQAPKQPQEVPEEQPTTKITTLDSKASTPEEEPAAASQDADCPVVVAHVMNSSAAHKTPEDATTQAMASTTSNPSGGTAAAAIGFLSTHTTMNSAGSNPQSTWDKAAALFALTPPEDLLADLHDLKYIGAGGYGKVFKAAWRSAPAAVKLVPSNSPELFKSSSYKEALLCKELCHPNIVQTYETRCARLSEEFVNSILSETETPLLGQVQKQALQQNQQMQSYGSQEFVSGDGFGRPSPVPDMLVQGKTLSEAAAKWKDILFTTGAEAGDYLTVIIMDYCDYGSLVRPIAKGMFRPFSASGSDREARVRYRALLRTAKEIAQGLEHLHHLKVVHGDLKPGNVLLKGSRVDVRGFNAQVIDFGLSHMVNNSNPQKVSKAGGTLVYAAPEVFSGKVSKAADVYSLGIILWEMATGSQPYKDLVEGQIVLGVQTGRLRPAWPPGQLPKLQVLYEKCVAQDPDERPKAKEVVQYLTQIEMDLRSELKAAHKQQQQQHQQFVLQQQMILQQQLQAAHMQQQGLAAGSM